MVSRSEFDFTRQCIVVADDDSPAAAFLVETLRLDGHLVTHVHVSEGPSAAVDRALGECHLFICGSAIGGMRAVNLIGEVRDNAPALPVLCVAAALRWTHRLEGRLPADVTILREPFTAEALRAGVRPLLPLTSGGTTMAWPAVDQQRAAEA